MGIIGAIVSAVVGVALATGAAIGVVNGLASTPDPVDKPLIDYYGQR
jgi:hypothetical protein